MKLRGLGILACALGALHGCSSSGSGQVPAADDASATAEPASTASGSSSTSATAHAPDSAVTPGVPTSNPLDAADASNAPGTGTDASQATDGSDAAPPPSVLDAASSTANGASTALPIPGSCEAQCELGTSNECLEDRQTVCLQSGDGCPRQLEVECACFEAGPCLQIDHHTWDTRTTGYGHAVAFAEDERAWVCATDWSTEHWSTVQAGNNPPGALGGFAFGEPEPQMLPWESNFRMTTEALTFDAQGNLVMVADGDPANQDLDGYELFARKLTPEGEVAWQVSWGSANADQATAVGLDALANVYVQGYAEGAVEEAVALGKRDAFLTKLNAAGEYQWTIQFGGAGDDFARDLAVDAAGNSYSIAQTSGEDGYATGGFLVKHSPDGDELWRDDFSLIPRTVVLHGEQLYVVGTAGSAFVLVYSTAGEALDSHGMPFESVGVSLAVTSDDRIFLLGTSPRRIEGAISHRMRAGTVAFFVSELSTAFDVLWTYEWDSQWGTSATDIAVSPTGLLAVVGGVDGEFHGLPGDGMRPVVSFLRILER